MIKTLTKIITLHIDAEYTANPIKVVLRKALTVDYEHTTDDRLLFIFTSKHGIISLKHHRGHIGNLQWQIYLLQR